MYQNLAIVCLSVGTAIISFLGGRRIGYLDRMIDERRELKRMAEDLKEIDWNKVEGINRTNEDLRQ